MSIDRFKTKLSYGARPTLFEIVVNIPNPVIKALGVNANDIVDDFKFHVSSTQVPGRTLGDIVTNYQGQEVKQAGDPVYTDITYTFYNDLNYKIRSYIEYWHEYIVSTENNARALPEEYQTQWDIYQVKNTVDSSGNKERVKGWRCFDGYPSSYAAIDKNWDTKDTIEIGTFVLRYNYFKRIDVNGNLIIPSF